MPALTLGVSRRRRTHRTPLSVGVPIEIGLVHALIITHGGGSLRPRAQAHPSPCRTSGELRAKCGKTLVRES